MNNQPKRSRNQRSRGPEIRTSVIGTVGRTAQNMQFDNEELELRTKKLKSAAFVSVYEKCQVPGINDVTAEYVDCVEETEIAAYYAPNTNTTRALSGNLGRQPYFWTCINGIKIPLPEGFRNVDEFHALPWEVKVEFIDEKIMIRGMAQTSWQRTSELAGVTSKKISVAKAGTAMMHPMYRTRLLMGSPFGAFAPTEEDLKTKVPTPNRDDGKYLLALKSITEAENVYKKGLEIVLDNAEKYQADKNDPTINKGLKRLFDHINTLDQEPKTLTTPFKLLYSVSAEMKRAVGGAAELSAYFTDVKNLVRQKSIINKLLYDQRVLIDSKTVGVALTSGIQGQPVDVLLGRVKNF